MQPPDYTKPGFAGDDNIYGIGIRVGYYTQAASIWVANFYARHEAPYLHTLTLMFLIALFTGMCLLCKEPRNTYAVEPYMLLTVAYNTLYMGLFDLKAPNPLSWEINFKERLSVDIVWIAFYGFDMWFWWSGVWVMKPSNGPRGTVIFFPYVGEVELFGWIHIVAKTYNAVAVIALLMSTVTLCCYAAQQKKMDRSMSAKRILDLTEQWLRTIDRQWNYPQPNIGVDSPNSTFGLIVPMPDRRHSNAASIGTMQTRRSNLSIRHTRSDTCNDTSSEEAGSGERDNTKASKVPHRKSTAPDSTPPLTQITRTGTGLLKKGLLGWSREKDTSHSTMPPDYMAYEPSFQRLRTAMNTLITASAKKPTQGKFLGRKIHRFLAHCPEWLFQFCAYIFMQIRHPTFRPAVLFAALSHAHNIGSWDAASFPRVLQRVIEDPEYPSLQSDDLVLASRLYFLNNPPTQPPRWITRTVGWATFGACSVLVISTELTIQWNKISGVQDISSVGQMVPFVLGIGGLLKVLYAAICEQEHQDQGLLCYYGHCQEEDREKDWIQAGQNFEKCMDAYERTQALPMLKGGDSIT